MTELSKKSLLLQLAGQDRVRGFLTSAVESGRTSHAYLFVGAPGSGKLEAAWALAQALLCQDGACGNCDDCRRVARHTHPDVRYVEPESTTGYLVEQIRELLDDVALAPIRAKGKVYIIDRAELLRANTANAILKTLEEPPAGVTFILLGTSTDVMLSTIVSRCQCVPFRAASPTSSAEQVMRATGLPLEKCRMAIGITGSTTRAVAFLKSADRQETRRQAVRAVGSLAHADAADILARAEALTLAAKAPLSKLASDQEKALERDADYLSRGAMKQLEARNKRELNARERSGIMEVLTCVRSLLRDCLLVLEEVPGGIVNEDARDTIERVTAKATPAGVCAAIDAVDAATKNVAKNVNPQLALEVMLFDMRKALACRK